MRTQSLAALAIASLPSAALAATLTAGPYLQLPRPDGVVIVFDTDEPVACQVRHWVRQGSSAVTPCQDSGSTHHEVMLEGLEPATEHGYQVILDGVAAGSPGIFRTSPVSQESFSFIVYGDNRSDAAAYALMVSRMIQHPASFVINTGDMVSDGEDEAQWTEFLSIGASLMRDLPLWPTVGNHDEHGHEAPPPLLRLFVTPSDADHPTYYSFDHAGSHFVVLDSHVATFADPDCVLWIEAFEECLDASQAAWLEEDLRRAAADPAVRHVFVAVHMGPYSSKPGRTGWAQMRALLHRLGQGKVRMILSGHDHMYERGMTANGLVYLVTGGGGAPLYETTPEEQSGTYVHRVDVSTTTYNFAVVRVDGDAIDVVAYDAQGTVIDSFGVAPGPACAAATDCTGQREEGTCEGGWTCAPEGRCLWTCGQGARCGSPDDCGPAPRDLCGGAWHCESGRCDLRCPPAPAPAPEEVVASPDAGAGAGEQAAGPGPGAGGGGCAAAAVPGAAWPLLMLPALALRGARRPRQGIPMNASGTQPSRPDERRTRTKPPLDSMWRTSAPSGSDMDRSTASIDSYRGASSATTTATR